MTSVSAALADLRRAFEGLVADHSHMRQQLQSLLRNGSSVARSARGRAAGGKKRGRAFKFSDEQAAEFRKRAEAGTSAVALAKDLKVSLPTMYNTLKRAGWKGRK
jgi:DNA invertase Pin-like site-specific DNA recombinase